MRNIARRRDGSVFGLLLAGQVLLPLLSIALFQRRYEYQPRAVGYHLLIVEVGYLALLGAASLFCAARELRGKRLTGYVIPLLWGLGTVALYYTYLLAWGGRLSNGMNLKPTWVIPYVLHPALAASTFAISPLVIWGVVVFVPLAILAGYAACRRTFSAVLLRLRIRFRGKMRRSVPRWRWLGGAVVLAGALLWAGHAAVERWPPDQVAEHLFGDPIFASLRPENSTLPFSGLNTGSDAARRGYAVPGTFRRKNVVLIVVDAARADHFGPKGYGRKITPFLDSLQSGGHLRVVRSFHAASCCTFGGVLTLLRSQNWFKMGLHGFALHDVLRKAGYRVHFILGGDHTHFDNMKALYGPEIDLYSDGLSRDRHFTFNDDRGVLESFENVPAYDGTPSFFYFHLMSVHFLGTRLPENERYEPSGTSHNVEKYVNHYDNGILQTDGNIRALFEGLQRKGYLQDSVVVITSDHGESLGERGCYGHGYNLYAEEVEPPLFIYDPDPVVYRNLDFARQIDVAPTILDRLGLPIPALWDGRSLLSGDPPRFSYLRIGDTYAVLDHTPARTLKYIYNARTKQEELYDETADPTDQKNIFPTVDPQLLADLRTAIGEFSVHPGT